MSRVDAYAEIGNDLGAHRSVGGQRGNARRVWARLNTDNAGQSDCALHVSAEVIGERRRGGRAPRKTCQSCGRRWAEGEARCPDCGVLRQGIDTRRTVFKVGLPGKVHRPGRSADDFCEVQICVGNPALAELAAVGVFLCAVKGASQAAAGDRKRGVATLATAGRILAELERQASENLPRVVLPGGVTLAHALACVEIVRDLIGGPPKGN